MTFVKTIVGKSLAFGGKLGYIPSKAHIDILEYDIVVETPEI